MTRGHVFVVHGDLTKLACDDVIIPTDRSLTVSRSWHRIITRPIRLPDLGLDASRWAEQRHAKLRQGVWLADTGGTSLHEIDWFTDGIRRVLEAVAHAREGLVPARGRARHLVALPLVGVGAGGASRRRGQMISALLSVLEEHADAGHDVALVLSTSRDHGAVQQVRRDHELVRHDLTEDERAAAVQLAHRARADDLALFLGAGVSMSAGLPSWGGLLDQLAERTSLSASEKEALHRLPPQDAATVLEANLEGSLTDALSTLLRTELHGLSHALLAALPTRAAVTTNYDGLLEAAWVGVGHQPAVLPFSSPVPGQPWVLKLHGDLDHEDSVVLTRDHYLEFTETRGALAGVVQGLLMTRHVLFAGFGMADDNFVRLAHGVRRVRRDQGPVGTVLALTEDPMRRRLWKDELRFRSFGPENSTAAEPARKLEIFLDLLAHEATDDASFLLDDRYASMRTAEDTSLAEALRAVEEHAQGGSSAARQVRALLVRLGSTWTR